MGHHENPAHVAPPCRVVERLQLPAWPMKVAWPQWSTGPKMVPTSAMSRRSCPRCPTRPAGRRPDAVRADELDHRGAAGVGDRASSGSAAPRTADASGNSGDVAARRVLAAEAASRGVPRRRVRGPVPEAHGPARIPHDRQVLPLHQAPLRHRHGRAAAAGRPVEPGRARGRRHQPSLTGGPADHRPPAAGLNPCRASGPASAPAP